MVNERFKTYLRMWRRFSLFSSKRLRPTLIVFACNSRWTPNMNISLNWSQLGNGVCGGGGFIPRTNDESTKESDALVWALWQHVNSMTNLDKKRVDTSLVTKEENTTGVFSVVRGSRVSGRLSNRAEKHEVFSCQLGGCVIC